MATTGIAVKDQSEQFQISPDYVRISAAAAIELGLKKGQINGCNCGCINLLQNYPQGCAANCSYCGLARERPGLAEGNSFIRVDWPLFETDLIARKIAEKEADSEVGRVCIAQVQDHRAMADLVDMTMRIRASARNVPISALVMATLLSTDDLHAIKEAGADIVGVGLDAASEAVFQKTRGKLARGPHRWDHHWHIVREARRIYGPMNVNCHIVVGLGETDLELVELFYLLHSEQIAGYLFSFNPEPGTAMQDVPRASIERWRRIQYVKFLIENHSLERDAIKFDDDGNMAALEPPAGSAKLAFESGLAFMTNGCPDRHGAMACNRPYGSYRPGEEYRDYPFVPSLADRIEIARQAKLDNIWKDAGKTLNFASH